MQFATPACAAGPAIATASPPPTSLINTAVLVVQSRPPSENESGVTLRMPIARHRAAGRRRGGGGDPSRRLCGFSGAALS